MPKTAHNPDTLFNSLQYGFSQITIGQGSRLVSISGQVGWDAQEQIVNATDLGQQARQAFHNLGLALAAVDATLDDILLLHIYIVADVMDESKAIREALQTFFPIAPPAASWIGVPRLANPDFLVEVEALAILH